MQFLKRFSLLLFILTSFNANALLIKLDFETLGSVDMWGNVTSSFNEAQAIGLNESYSNLTNAILEAVRGDYYSTSYSFLNVEQQLDIDFMISSAATDVFDIDPEHYTIQIGTRTSGPHAGFGVACYGCAVGTSQSGSQYKDVANTVFGSVFSNNIFDWLLGDAGGSYDLNEAVNAIAGTLSHEIGHALGLDHPPGMQINPGESAWGIMATGSTFMPNAERLSDRAFSDINMQYLVDTIGTRMIQSEPQPVSEPTTIISFLLSLCLLMGSAIIRKISTDKNNVVQPGSSLSC